jgi:hypothetical protein
MLQRAELAVKGILTESGLIPERFATPAHFAASCLTNLANSAGVLPVLVTLN